MNRIMRSSCTPILLLWLCVVGLVSSSCTKDERLTTIHASVVSVDAACDQFATWDLEHMRKLLAESTTREEALAKIAAYEEKRKLVIAGCSETYKALALAATQNDQPSLDAALQAVKGVIDTITKLRGGP